MSALQRLEILNCMRNVWNVNWLGFFGFWLLSWNILKSGLSLNQKLVCGREYVCTIVFYTLLFHFMWFVVLIRCCCSNFPVVQLSHEATPHCVDTIAFSQRWSTLACNSLCVIAIFTRTLSRLVQVMTNKTDELGIDFCDVLCCVCECFHDHWQVRPAVFKSLNGLKNMQSNIWLWKKKRKKSTYQRFVE